MSQLKTNTQSSVVRLVLSALFLALGLVLPFLTGQIQQIGNMLLPMHLPVLLCGFICGWPYGLAVGAVLPIMRSALFTMPVLYPGAIAMAFELATYGFLAGFVFGRARWQCVRSLYRALIVAMLGGRLVWGLAMLCLLGVNGKLFTLGAFWTGAFANALPGIMLQLVLIPSVMLLFHKTHLMPMRKKPKPDDEVPL